ncbi:MAG TPA: response regulator [Bacteroidota bacterium]
MTQLTPRDDARKLVSEILKRVDQLIKAGEIDNSVREVIRAKEIDPSNVYIYAYEERLAYLKAEHEKNAERERTRKEAEEAARKRDEELRRQKEDEQRRRTELKQQDEGQRKEEDRLKQQAERVRAEAPKTVATEVGALVDQQNVDGGVIREPAESASANVQRAPRVPEIRTAPSDIPGEQTGGRRHSIAALRKTSATNTILVIDDDVNMLEAVSQMLMGNGYEVAPVSTSDEAFALLKTWKPQLILCDVNLETSTMGGFSFFEKTRDLEGVASIPFVFLTGLNDEVLVRKGKEMGVDDYLLKPISEENLIATVKGKLKRFNDLKRNSS